MENNFFSTRFDEEKQLFEIRAQANKGRNWQPTMLAAFYLNTDNEHIPNVSQNIIKKLNSENNQSETPSKYFQVIYHTEEKGQVEQQSRGIQTTITTPIFITLDLFTADCNAIMQNLHAHNILKIDVIYISNVNMQPEQEYQITTRHTYYGIQNIGNYRQIPHCLLFFTALERATSTIMIDKTTQINQGTIVSKDSSQIPSDNTE